MNLLTTYHIGVIIFTVCAIGTFFSLLKIKAPYGRHNDHANHISITCRTGWIMMELPSVAVFTLLFFSGYHFGAPHIPTLSAIVLASLWLMHYLQRTFIFPFRLRAPKKTMPLLIVLLGCLFNVCNSALNAYGLNTVMTTQPLNALFPIGIMIFLVGFFINLRADHLLFQLRGTGDTGYKIPTGFLFNWISAPNYLGEMLEWLGFALAAGTGAAWVFCLYTVANLLPRALTHHQWYHTHFPDYPKNRKALIPYLL